MALAWSTVVILLLLLPGFLFFIGMYFPGPVSRDSAPQTAIQQLSSVVLVSSLVHGLLYLFVDWACGPFFPCINLEFVLSALQGAQTPSVSDLAENLRIYFPWVFWYLILSAAAGLLFGSRVGRMIVCGRFRSFVLHKWAYKLLDTPDGSESYPYAYVMTNVREGPRILMYRGLLEEFVVAPDGRISYLVLRGCSRYYMHLEDGAPKTSAMAEWKEIGESQDAEFNAKVQWRFMMIEGEDIANVVFERYKLIATEEDLKELDKELESMPPSYPADVD